MGCTSTWIGDFPNTDIVYQAKDVDSPVVGFINADGTNNDILDIGLYANEPTWSNDGSTIYFRQQAGDSGYLQPSIGKISMWQERVKSCDNDLSIRSQIIPLNIHEILISNGFKISKVDADSCREKDIILDYWIPSSTNRYSIFGFSVSRDGRYIIYSEAYLPQPGSNPPDNQRQYKIKIMNLISNEIIEVGEGINPSLSPNNELIAFVWYDGIYIMNIDGSERRQIVQYQTTWMPKSFKLNTPIPRWSPDGEWIIYHKCNFNAQGYCSHTSNYSIFKSRVSDGKEIKLVDGGLYPYWRER